MHIILKFADNLVHTHLLRAIWRTCSPHTDCLLHKLKVTAYPRPFVYDPKAHTILTAPSPVNMIYSFVPNTRTLTDLLSSSSKEPACRCPVSLTALWCHELLIVLIFDADCFPFWFSRTIAWQMRELCNMVVAVRRWGRWRCGLLYFFVAYFNRLKTTAACKANLWLSL